MTTLQQNISNLAIAIGQDMKLITTRISGLESSSSSSFSTFQFENLNPLYGEPNSLVAEGADIIKFVAGAGLSISTSATPAGKTVTINSTITGGNNTIKTFNVLGDFGPIIGKAIFVPTTISVVTAVQMNVGQIVTQDLMVGLYRNGELLNFFTIPAGKFSAKYNGFSYTLTTNDYVTVNVVAGQGTNLSMALLSSDI
jgi:hypothetical protein